MTLASVLLIVSPKRRARGCFLGVVLLAGGLCMVQGCGGGSGGSTPRPGNPDATPAGTYMITVTAASAGAQAQSASLTLTVTN